MRQLFTHEFLFEPRLKALQILSLSWLSFLDVFVSFEPCFEESEGLSSFLIFCWGQRADKTQFWGVGMVNRASDLFAWQTCLLCH